MKYNEYIDLVNSIDVRVDYQHKLGCIYVKGNLYGCPFEIENLCHYTFTLNGVPLGLLITKHNNNKVEVKVEVIGNNNTDVYGEVLAPIYKNAEITSIPFDKEVFEIISQFLEWVELHIINIFHQFNSQLEVKSFIVC